MTVTASKKQSRATPGSADFNTLDEPIRETFVSKKIVLFDSNDELAKLMTRPILTASGCSCCWAKVRSCTLSEGEK